MKYQGFSFIAFSLFFIGKVKSDAFNATSNKNIVYYWGQNSAGALPNSVDPQGLWQKPLKFYCDDDDKDIIVLSFLHQYGQGRNTAFDLANRGQDCKGVIEGTQLLNCPHMEDEIKYCQSKDKKIIMSMGGATPAYGLGTIKEGENLADELWETFGGGNNATITRPFGNVSVDGFDLDIENGEKVGYTAFVNKMRKNYATDSSKTYYIAAAPQCPYPDYFLGESLNQAWFDFVMIQFYNNYCNIINDNSFNYDIWDEWATTKSINKDVRLFVGIPGSPTAAARGYVPYTELVNRIKPLQSLTSFGGIMVWDISQAYANTNDVLPNYAHGISRLIHDDKDEGLPIELAPVTISNAVAATGNTTLIPKITRTKPITLITTSTSTVFHTVTSRSVEAPLITTATSTADCNVIAPTTVSYSTSEIFWTTTIMQGIASSPIESVITSKSIVTFYNTNRTEQACEISPNITIAPAITTAASGSMSVYPLGPLPVHGEKCENEGKFRCSGHDTFAQCGFGQWVLRSCTPGTVCKENYSTNTHSVYCGFE